MPKVALINPGKDERYAVQEPLNLGFIASFLLKHNIDVIIINELAGQDVKKELEKYRPNIVGITATTPLVADAYRIAKLTRGMGILTVMGGVHASILPEEALQYVNIVVKGEGELAMLDIVRNNIRAGIVSRPFIKNIDDIPSPARHLLQMDFYLQTKDRLPDTYLDFVPPHTKTAAILTSRGCPFACTFCHNTWRDAPYRFNSAERVISEIEGLIKDYGIQALFFIEDNFFVNRPRLKRICELIKEKKINIIWGANARVDNIDLETLKMAKAAGCRQVTFGFESGSQRILNVLNKKTTVEQNKRAVELCQQAGLIAQGTVMIGNPTETIEDVRLTQQFVKEIDAYSIGVCITTPFPGTKIWDWCKGRGLIPRSFKWSDFTYDKVAIPACDTISPEEIQRLYRETMDIISEKLPFKISHYLIKNLRHPGKGIIKMLSTLKDPIRIIKYLKRVKW